MIVDGGDDMGDDDRGDGDNDDVATAIVIYASYHLLKHQHPSIHPSLWTRRSHRTIRRPPLEKGMPS